MTETETLIVDMLQMGRCKDVIVAKAKAAGWSTFDVVETAKAHGYDFDVATGQPFTIAKAKATRPRAQLDPVAIAPKAAFVPSPAPAAPATPPAPAQQDHDVREAAQLVGLLVSAGRSGNKLVQRRLTAVHHAVDDLRRTVDAAAAKDRAVAAARAERARKQAEVDRLAQQLQAARAALRRHSAADPVVSQPGDRYEGARGLGLNAKDIRAWAAANDVDCPTTKGRVPKAVVEQYLAATRQVAG